MKTIQELREAYGWTHFELAYRVGMRPGTIRDWEAGRARPRAIHMRRLAEVFGVNVDFIQLDVSASNRGSTDEDC